MLTFQSAKLIFAAILVVDVVVLIYTFAVGNLGSEGSQLLKLPWGVYTFVDIYAMFIIFSIWIWFRTSSLWVALVEIVLTMVLGSVFCLGYVLALLFICEQENWESLFMGYRAKQGNLI